MAKNSYNPYYDVNQIYNYKGQYDKAKNSGDSQLAQQIASYAQQNYNNLRSNGYEDVAKSLGDVGYAGAKKIRDKYAMQGKVAIRPYLYNSKLKTKYGMSDADIDKALSFNETTGEVSLGGMNLGSPYSNVDGTTYWDSSSLDKGIEDYISHSGITPSKTELINQNNAGVLDKTNALYDLQMNDHKDLSGKYNELYDKAMNENPFETPTGQSIMNEYKLKGAQAGENAKAEGGASNSGNIDSYAAANALRQQAALTSKGQQMAIAAQTEAINNVRGILGDIGGSQQNSYAGMQKTIGLQQSEGSRLFDEQQTEKMNDHSINYDIANVTGVVPSSWMTSVNPYFNEDGTLKNENLDYGIEIEKVDEKLKNTEDPVERNRLLNERNYLYAARQYKTNPENYGGKYTQYAGKQFEGGGYSPMRTLGAQQTEYNYDLGLGTNANEKLGIEYGRESEKEQNATSDKAVEYGHEEAMGQIDFNNKNSAYDVVIAMASNNIPPSAQLLEAAGYAGITGEQFLATYNSNKDKYKPVDNKRSALYQKAINGDVITQDELNAAGYTGYTPDTFRAEILENIKTTDNTINGDSKQAEAMSQVATWLQAGIAPPDSLVEKAGYSGKTGEQLLEDYLTSPDKYKSSNQKYSEVFNLVIMGAPITQTMLDEAGLTNYTPDSYKKEVLGNITNIDEAKNAAQSKQGAIAYVSQLLAAGQPVPDDLAKKAGYTVSGEQLMEDYQKNKDKYTPKSDHLSTLFNAVVNGFDITQEMLDNAGYSNYTPDSFKDSYLKNLGARYEVEKKNPDVSDSKSSSSSSKSSSKVSDSDNSKVKLSKTDKQAIMKEIDDNGGTGLKKLLDTYDWDKYDPEDIYNYILNNYGDNKEVMAVAYEYFDVPNPDKVKTAAKTVAESVNALYAKDSEEFVTNPPIKAYNGGYTVGSSTVTRVIDTVYKDTTLTDKEAMEVLKLFGISEEQVKEYQDNQNYEK